MSRKSKSKIVTKPPRGTRDLFPSDVLIRRRIFAQLVKLYEKYGGQPIQTPIIEQLDTVRNLYGEEFKKLVYTLDDGSDEGDSKKEQLLLRYDLTVPCARFCANNGIIQFKRYQIGPVFRRDNVQIKKGRLRQFYQADFDIIGPDNGQMIQESEILNLLIECLETLLSKDTFTVQLNSRKILFYILSSKIGVDSDLILPVCSTLDKLDKFSEDEWESKTIEELTEKRVDSTQIGEVIEFVRSFRRYDGSNEEKLARMLELGYIDEGIKEELDLLFDYISMTGIDNYIVFNPLLSRGLDYYTGIIYEAVYNDKRIMESSIAAGGRYDGILGKLSNKKTIPCIGMSLGIERIVTILEKLGDRVPETKPTVFVATVGKNMLRERVKLVNELRKAGIRTDMVYSKNPKMGKQLNNVLERQISYMIVIGENEINKGTVQLKTIAEETQVELDRSEAIEFLLNKN